MEIEKLYEAYAASGQVSTDTRNISPGCVFFALKGENFDGNSFASEALEAGASFAVIDDASYRSDERYILVPNTLQALQDLGAYHRDQISIPFIGITGSNGKTTTKELFHSVLSQRFKTYATKGNLNNHIGVPLTLLSIGKDIEVAIIEMGANHQKEIEALCKIARPTHGLITNIGRAHLEGFGGPAGVMKGKGELYDWLAASDGIAFINQDNLTLVNMAKERGMKRLVFYGMGYEGLVSGELIENNPFLKIQWQLVSTRKADEKQTVETQLTGAYNLENLLSAACIGAFFELSPEEVSRGLSTFNWQSR